METRETIMLHFKNVTAGNAQADAAHRLMLQSTLGAAMEDKPRTRSSHALKVSRMDSLK
jgi:hypothetical protein